MTRERAIDAAVRKWWHILDIPKLDRAAREFGIKKSLALPRHRLFIKCVRMSFAEMVKFGEPG